MNPLFKIRRVSLICWKVYFGGVFLTASGAEREAVGKVHQLQAVLRKHLRQSFSAEPEITQDYQP